MTRSLRVRLIWCGPGQWLGPAEVRWDAAGRIVALRRVRGDVRPWALFPGLVDAHVHLQIPALVAPPRAFVPWIGAVLAARERQTPDDWRRRARAALTDLIADGTTAVGEIDSTGVSLPVLAHTRIAGRVYREITGFHLDAEAARHLVQSRRLAGSPRLATGMSPHAPYSVSPALFQAAARASRFLSVHCAETHDEQHFLRRGAGPFAALLASMGRLPPGFRPPGMGAVRWLRHLGVLRPTTQLVHCQHLERGDVAVIAAAGASIAVCPGTIRWFGRPLPPVPTWLAAGIPVALGTDSRASNGCLSMRAELALAAAAWPDLAPETLLAMATIHGARSLGRPGLGRIRRGGRADFFAVGPVHDDRGALVADVVNARTATVATWIAGRRCHGPAR